MTNLDLTVPKEMSIIQQIVSEYPSPRINNSRSIVRKDLERLREMGMKGVAIAQREYNIDLDYTPGYDDDAHALQGHPFGESIHDWSGSHEEQLANLY